MSETKIGRRSGLSRSSASRLRWQGRFAESLFVLAMIALPFSAQGVEPLGVTLELSYLFVLLFSVVYFGKTPPHLVDRQDLLCLLFLFVAVMSLSCNVVGGRVADTSKLGSGLRFSARPLVHLARFFSYYVIYKAFKGFLSRKGSWMRRQHLFYEGLLVAAWIPGIYGSYQFLARRFDWPLANINNLHAAGAYLTVDYLKDSREPFYTIFATFGETKTYAGFLLAIVPLLLGILLTRKSKTISNSLPVFKFSPGWLCVLIGTLITHFFLGFSRTGYVALALLTLFTFLFISRKSAIMMCLLALFFFVGISLFMGKSPLSLLSQFLASFWDPQGTSAANILRWQAALRETGKSPILGYGLGNAFSEPLVIDFTVRKLWFGAPGVLGYLLPAVGCLGTLLFLAFLAGHIWLSLSNLRRLDREDRFYYLLMFSLVAVVGSWTIGFIHFHMNATWPWIILAENAALNRVVRLDH